MDAQDASGLSSAGFDKLEAKRIEWHLGKRAQHFVIVGQKVVNSAKSSPALHTSKTRLVS